MFMLIRARLPKRDSEYGAHFVRLVQALLNAVGELLFVEVPVKEGAMIDSALQQLIRKQKCGCATF